MLVSIARALEPDMHKGPLRPVDRRKPKALRETLVRLNPRLTTVESVALSPSESCNPRQNQPSRVWMPHQWKTL